MTSLEVERTIVDKLRSDIGGVKIEPSPSRPEEYVQKAAGGCLLVRYIGSTYTTTGGAIQQRFPRISIVAGAKSLRAMDGHHGALDIMEEALFSLTGFKIDGTHRLFPKSDLFVREEKGVWWYGIELETSSLHAR